MEKKVILPLRCFWETLAQHLQHTDTVQLITEDTGSQWVIQAAILGLPAKLIIFSLGQVCLYKHYTVSVQYP